MPSDPSKNFVCIRVEPIKKWGRGELNLAGNSGKKSGLAGYLGHDFRFFDTPNADQKLTSYNVIISKKTKWKELQATRKNLEKIGIIDEHSVSKSAEKKLRRLKVPVQENSIVATALMLSLSPQYLRDGDETREINSEKLTNMVNGSIKFLRKKFGNRLLLVCLHMDEMNPHISAYILPLVKKKIRKRGVSSADEKGLPRAFRMQTRLGHTEMFTRDKLIYDLEKDGKTRIYKGLIPGTCSKLQDEYADALVEEGLEVQRGIRTLPGEKKLKYVKVKEQYQRLIRGIEKTEVLLKKLPDMSEEERVELIKQCIAKANEAENLRKDRDHYQKVGKKTQNKLTSLEEEIAGSMRDLPVAEVIQAITGAEPILRNSGAKPSANHGSDLENTADTRIEFQLSNGQKITVNAVRNHFENLTPKIPFLGEGAKRKSAVGAINAVMYLSGCSYDSAIARLATHFDNEAAKRAAARKIEEDIEQVKQRLVEPDETKWPELFAKLKAWNIDEEAIQIALNAGSITANAEGQFLFTKELWNENVEVKRTGSIVVDPMFPEAETMETGEDGIFPLQQGDAKRTIFCASPLDALAIKSKNDYRDANVISIGKSPGENTKQSVKLFLSIHPDNVFYAENLLATGRKITDWIAENFREFIKFLPLPKGCRDWLSHQIHPVSQIQTAPKDAINFDDFK